MPTPIELKVLIELPRGSFIKRREDGSIDFISPVPCPFNYGSVPGTLADDGDREDAVVLGPGLTRNAVVEQPVLGRVHFYDAGKYDPKWICGQQLSTGQKLAVEWFFRVYARCKRVLNVTRGMHGTTAFHELELLPPRAKS